MTWPFEYRVQVRMRRQDALAKAEPVSLWAVIDEAAIRRQIGGPAVMKDQLSHLVDVARSPNVILQVLPYTAGAPPGMPGAFLVMEFPDDDPALVYTESASGGLFLEAGADVERYRSVFQHLLANALSSQETVQVLNQAAKAA